MKVSRSLNFHRSFPQSVPRRYQPTIWAAKFHQTSILKAEVRLQADYSPIEFSSSRSRDLFRQLIENSSVNNDNHRHLFLQIDAVEQNKSNLFQVLQLLEVVHSGSVFPLTNFEDLLLQFEEKSSKKLLKTWEQSLVAGCLAFYEGHYLKSANLYEQALLSTSPVLEPLLLRVTQTAYLKAGATENVLGTLARYSKTMEHDESLRPTLLALLSMGFTENNRYRDGEEISKRAVMMSARSDVHPLIALSYNHYFQGKSSHITEIYNKYVPHFRYGNQRFHLFCLRGHALIMRGNCNGAFNTLLDILDDIPKEIANAEEYNEKEVANSIVLSFPLYLEMVFLLWKLNIHLTSRHMINVDSVVDPLLVQLEKYGQFVLPEMKMLIKTILLATKLNALETKNSKRQLDNYEKDLTSRAEPKIDPAKSEFSLSNIFAAITQRKPKTRAYEHERGASDSQDGSGYESSGESSSSAPAPGLLIEDGDYDLAFVGEYDEQAKEDIQTQRAALSDLFASHRGICEKEYRERKTLTQRLPNLLNSRPHEAHLSYSNANSAQSLDRAVESRKELFYTLIEAFAAFGQRDYKRACEELSKSIHDSYQVSGLSKLHRDVICQTFQESLIRSNQFSSAKTLLVERTVVLPSDGQTFLRLMRVNKALGDMAAAEEAQSMAFEIGIGQGGFGGHI